MSRQLWDSKGQQAIDLAYARGALDARFKPNKPNPFPPGARHRAWEGGSND